MAVAWQPSRLNGVSHSYGMRAEEKHCPPCRFLALCRTKETWGILLCRCDWHSPRLGKRLSLWESDGLSEWTSDLERFARRSGTQAGERLCAPCHPTAIGPSPCTGVALACCIWCVDVKSPSPEM